MARYCGHCGQRGHNRRTCPHRSDEAKAQDKKWMRTPGRRKGSTTQCSYCGGVGHNRRTCPHLKLRKKTALRLIDSAVHRATRILSENGFGLGAMYEKQNPWYREEKNTYAVSSHPLVVEYEETRYRDDLDWSQEKVPTFTFSVYGQFLYGSDSRTQRHQATKLSVYYDRNGREVTSTNDLRRFNSDERTRWIGQSHSSYNSLTKEAIREAAMSQVEQFFKNKDNVHPAFGHIDAWVAGGENV